MDGEQKRLPRSQLSQNRPTRPEYSRTLRFSATASVYMTVTQNDSTHRKCKLAYILEIDVARKRKGGGVSDQSLDLRTCTAACQLFHSTANTATALMSSGCALTGVVLGERGQFGQAVESLLGDSVVLPHLRCVDIDNLNAHQPPHTHTHGEQDQHNIFHRRRHRMAPVVTCSRPASSGRPISTCSSRRPGRNTASSIMSFLFRREKKKQSEGR
jgi:hypothetical protein